MPNLYWFELYKLLFGLRFVLHRMKISLTAVSFCLQVSQRTYQTIVAIRVSNNFFLLFVIFHHLPPPPSKPAFCCIVGFRFISEYPTLTLRLGVPPPQYGKAKLKSGNFHGTPIWNTFVNDVEQWVQPIFDCAINVIHINRSNACVWLVFLLLHSIYIVDCRAQWECIGRMLFGEFKPVFLLAAGKLWCLRY